MYAQIFENALLTAAGKAPTKLGRDLAPRVQALAPRQVLGEDCLHRVTAGAKAPLAPPAETAEAKAVVALPAAPPPAWQQAYQLRDDSELFGSTARTKAFLRASALTTGFDDALALARHSRKDGLTPAAAFELVISRAKTYQQALTVAELEFQHPLRMKEAFEKALRLAPDLDAQFTVIEKVIAADKGGLYHFGYYRVGMIQKWVESTLGNPVTNEQALETCRLAFAYAQGHGDLQVATFDRALGLAKTTDQALQTINRMTKYSHFKMSEALVKAGALAQTAPEIIQVVAVAQKAMCWAPSKWDRLALYPSAFGKETKDVLGMATAEMLGKAAGLARTAPEALEVVAASQKSGKWSRKIITPALQRAGELICNVEEGLQVARLAMPEGQDVLARQALRDALALASTPKEALAVANTAKKLGWPDLVPSALERASMLTP